MRGKARNPVGVGEQKEEFPICHFTDHSTKIQDCSLAGRSVLLLHSLQYCSLCRGRVKRNSEEEERALDQLPPSIYLFSSAER